MGTISTLCLFSSCNAVKTLGQAAAENFKDDWNQASDKTTLARVQSSLRWGTISEAWDYADKLHLPESRAEAFLHKLPFTKKTQQGSFNHKEVL